MISHRVDNREAQVVQGRALLEIGRHAIHAVGEHAQRSEVDVVAHCVNRTIAENGVERTGMGPAEHEAIASKLGSRGAGVGN